MGALKHGTGGNKRDWGHYMKLGALYGTGGIIRDWGHYIAADVKSSMQQIFSTYSFRKNIFSSTSLYRSLSRFKFKGLCCIFPLTLHSPLFP